MLNDCTEGTDAYTLLGPSNYVFNNMVASAAWNKMVSNPAQRTEALEYMIVEVKLFIIKIFCFFF